MRGETPDSTKNEGNFVEQGMRVTIDQSHKVTGNRAKINESIYCLRVSSL